MPNTIDVEYVQRVMDELDASLGEAFRQFKADGGPTPDNSAWLGQIYDEEWTSQLESTWGQLAAKQFEGVPAVPGDPKTTVLEIVREKSGSCVLVAVQRSLDEHLGGPTLSEDEQASYISLLMRPSLEERADRNPTKWKIQVDGNARDGEIPKVCR